ncbi:protein FAR1-RELATED SEQUENCE 5-like [Argentina anserina]|uniref:protein FAR1-RELATED SEQUENCE 5-like n=1 Tax=Argentina anserina TaxID=57926 RepID=UPI0021766A39|nr:protein FAR1-RELATED SEQUENCE 5-like [Potentilla anserina]
METILPVNESEQSEVSEPLQQYNGKLFTDLRTIDVVGQCFETEEAADKFYFDYGLVVGFCVRRDTLRCKKDMTVSSRQWFCSCQGFRKIDKNAKRVRRPQKVTRVGCQCVFKVNYCGDKKKYVVTKFYTDHNHPLVLPALTHHMRSARNCKDSDVAQVTAFHNASIRTCHAFEYLVDKVGGYVSVGFRIKDLYNKLDASRREIMLDGDVEAALSYLNGRSGGEENFYCKFSLDEENKLCNLFWRDTRSLIDYENFGDVLLFDSTYKTNRYGKPLLLFVGSSNHLTSIVFGCAFLLDETTETYVWALETFISSMNGKKPIAVLTDSDDSMRGAIEIVLPGCPHRLCSWHIGKNVNKNVKDPNLKKRFDKIMWKSTTPEEFDRSWSDMIQDFSPKNTKWFDMMYGKRQKWVEAYCKGKHFARMRSTQRCEGMNAYMKDFMNGLKLIEVVPGIVRAQGRLRAKYSDADFNCRHSVHILETQLREMEDDASKIYTDNVFFLVQKELKRVGGLCVKPAVQSDGFKTYIMWKHNRSEQSFEVVYSQGEGGPQFVCSCQKMEYEGIPCCHIFNVLKEEGILKIPTSLIMKRWRIIDKADVGKLDTRRLTGDKNEADSKLRFGYVSDMFSKLSFRASSSKETYEMVCEEIVKLERKIDAMFTVSEVHRQQDERGRHDNLIRDPNIVKGKGKKKRANTYYKETRKKMQQVWWLWA